MITTFKSPSTIHSAENSNYFVFTSDFRSAPRFNIRANFFAVSPLGLLNSFLLPTNPQNYSAIDAGAVISDFISVDPRTFITGPTASLQSLDYKVELSESFKGFYTFATAAAGVVSDVQIIGNQTITEIPLPSSVEEIGFIGGPITTPIDDIWIISYGTGPSGFVDSVVLGSGPSGPTGINGSIGASNGWLSPSGIGVFSIGATAETSVKSAVLANVDYFVWNEGNDFGDYTYGTNGKFLTNFRTQKVTASDFGTLSFINGGSASSMLVTHPGGTAIYPIPSGVRIDIPAGPQNLGLTGGVSYSIQILSSGGLPIGQSISFIPDTTSSVRACSFGFIGGQPTLTGGIRLTWLNDLGGYDFFNFPFTSTKRRSVNRETFNKPLDWQSTKSSRTFMSYKIEDWIELDCATSMVNSEEYEGLSSLFTSQYVFLIVSNELYPVEILSTSYDIESWDPQPVELTLRMSRSNLK